MFFSNAVAKPFSILHQLVFLLLKLFSPRYNRGAFPLKRQKMSSVGKPTLLIHLLLNDRFSELK